MQVHNDLFDACGSLIVAVTMYSVYTRSSPLNTVPCEYMCVCVCLLFLLYFQGISFKIPNVGRTPLDLHKLYKVGITVFTSFTLVPFSSF